MTDTHSTIAYRALIDREEAERLERRQATRNRVAYELLRAEFPGRAGSPPRACDTYSARQWCAAVGADWKVVRGWLRWRER